MSSTTYVTLHGMHTSSNIPTAEEIPLAKTFVQRNWKYIILGVVLIIVGIAGIEATSVLLSKATNNDEKEL